MQVLEHLHLAGVSSSALQQVLQQLPYTTGMRQLMQHLQQRAAHCIILSDSNSLFINWILSDRGHSSMFRWGWRLGGGTPGNWQVQAVC